MVFCPIAKGQCQGRAKCPAWSRGRLIATDTKLLATRLAKHILVHAPESRLNDGKPKLPPKEVATFWEEEGVPEIEATCLRDRYLAAKVAAVEALAAKWLSSPGFRASISPEDKS
ncbi:MAG: hypothetical protein ACFFCO_09625 [Promethearchaeota archaeon]